MANFLKIGAEKIYIDDYVYINRQVADIGTADLKCDNSREFSLRKTAQTIRVFEGANSVNSASLIPYSGIRGDLYLSGSLVWSNALILITDAGKSFNVIIKRGNVDFFEAIEGLLITDLDWSTHKHINTNAKAIEQNAASTYIYPLIHCGKAQDIGPFDFDACYSLPAMPLSLVVSKIFTEAGFSFSGNLFATAQYTKLFLGTIAKNKPDEFGTSASKLGANTYYFDVDEEDIQGIACTAFSGNDYDMLDNHAIAGVTSNATRYKYINGWKYTIEISFSYSYTCTIVDEGITGAQVAIFDGSTEKASWEVTRITSGTSTGTGTITLTNFSPTADGYLHLRVSNYDSMGLAESQITLSTFVMNVEIVNYDELIYSIPFDFALNLPNITQSDMIRIVCQLFGVYLTTDEYTKTVYFTMMSDVWAKKILGSYIDWSNFNIKPNPEINYIPPTSRILDFKWNSDNLSVSEIDTGNSHLTGREDYLKLNFDVPLNLPRSNGNFPIIPLYSWVTDEDGITSYSINGVGNWLLLMEKDTGSVVYFGESTETTNLPFCWFAPLNGQTESLNMSFIRDTFYFSKKKMLEEYKEVTIEIVIPPNEMEKIWTSYPVDSYAYPIYIAGMGYFFLKSIEKWSPGKYCTCTLIHFK